MPDSRCDPAALTEVVPLPIFSRGGRCISEPPFVVAITLPSAHDADPAARRKGPVFCACTISMQGV
jgi:hypothetical protein